MSLSIWNEKLGYAEFAIRQVLGSHKIVLEVQWKATGKCQGAPGINLRR